MKSRTDVKAGDVVVLTAVSVRNENVSYNSNRNNNVSLNINAIRFSIDD